MEVKPFDEWLYDTSVYRVDSPHELGVDCIAVHAGDVAGKIPRPCARYIGDMHEALYYRIGVHNIAAALSYAAEAPVPAHEALAVIEEVANL